jgi:hypothetical protein
MLYVVESLFSALPFSSNLILCLTLPPPPPGECVEWESLGLSPKSPAINPHWEKII